MLAAGVALAAFPTVLHADLAPPTADQAPIALMIDFNSGQVLHQRDADRRFVPASVTKVMTAFVAFELIESGKLDPNAVLTYRDEDFRQWHRKGSTMFLEEDARVTVDQLLTGITTVSANDACIVLAHGAAGSVAKWVELMNRTAFELGMYDSHFGTPNGWMDEGRTYVTAQDLGILATALIERHPELYRRYFGRPGMVYNGIAQDNHDPITGKVPGADGIKTGFTNEAGYNFLGSAQRGGRRLVMVLAGSDSAAQRNTAARNYIEWAFGAFETRRLLAKGAVVGEAAVQEGSARHVDLVAARPVVAEILPGTNPRIELRLVYQGPVQAPIRKGKRIAELEVRMEGAAPFRVPLEAAEDVGEANLFDRLVNGVFGLFG